MNNTETQDRIAKLKEPITKAIKDDPAERDQLVVLASRILAEAESTRQERRLGEAALHGHAEQWQNTLKHYATQIVEFNQRNVANGKAELRKSIEQCTEKVEDVSTTNRIFGKSLLIIAIVLVALQAWELFL